MPERCISIWDDLSNEKPGYYRAYWTAGPNDDIGCPVIGGGSHRTIKAAAREALRRFPESKAYRNGKIVA